MLALGPQPSLQSHSKHSAVPPCKTLTLEGVVSLQKGSNMEQHRFPPFSPLSVHSLCYKLACMGIAALKHQGCLAYRQLSLYNTPQKSLSEITQPWVGCCCLYAASPLLYSNPTCSSCPECSPSTVNMLNHTGEQLDWLVPLKSNMWPLPLLQA